MHNSNCQQQISLQGAGSPVRVQWDGGLVGCKNPLPEPQVSCVPWRLRIVWPWDVYFLLWNWVAVSLGCWFQIDGSWSWRRLKKSEVKSNLMNSFISGQGDFSWFVFATFSISNFSPTWMPCPKHFAISPRIYCSFYWFYWVSRHLLDALAGSSCAVSLDFFSSVSPAKSFP